MRIVDAHCHLESEELWDSAEAVIAEACKAGIIKLVTASVSASQWPRSESLAQRFPEVAFAWGVHPWFVRTEDLDAVRGLEVAREHGACAIGEIGLDAKIETPPMELQLAVFRAQLAIAREINLPPVIHCRGAFDVLLGVLKSIGAPPCGGLIHAYSGNAEIADALLPYGMRFSLGRSLTYRSSPKRERLLRRIYPDFLLLETDSPDMLPLGAKGDINTPANIVYTLRAAAEALGESEEQVAETTSSNAAQLFGFHI